MIRRLTCLAALMLSVGCTDDEPPAPEPPAGPTNVRVQRGFVRDDDGRAIVLRGVNLANAHKDAPYFGFHRSEDFARLRDDWGFNTIRLLMTWAAIEPSEGEYDEAYLDELAKRLDWARDAELHVVLDMHQDVYGEGFGGDGAPRWTCDASHYEAFEPIEPWFFNYLNEHVVACFDDFWGSDEKQAAFAAAWRHVAERFASHDAVLGFDILNEPYWGSAAMGSFEQVHLTPFYERVVSEVRAVAPDWIVFMEPAASRNLGLPTGLELMPFGDVVYAPHSYDQEAEQGNGFDPARRDAIVSNLALLREEADRLGAGLFIGEYGGQASHPGIGEYMDAQLDGMAAVASAGAYWAYDRDDGYGLLDSEGGEKPELMAALVRPAPLRVAGDPLSYDYDEATGAFELTWQAVSDVDGPTVISIPSRLYPDGYTVECDGCRHEPRDARLVVTEPPTGDPHVLKILRGP